MELPGSFEFSNLKVLQDWKDALQKFLNDADELDESDGDKLAEIKFSEKYGKAKKQVFCKSLAKAIAELPLENRELLLLCLKANCVVLRERGEELGPLIETEHLFRLFDYTIKSKEDSIQASCGKCLNNSFYGLEEVQKLFLEYLENHERGIDILWDLLSVGNETIGYTYNVLMFLVASENGFSISDQSCVKPTILTINRVVDLTHQVSERNDRWLKLNIGKGDKFHRAIENGLKFIYAIAASHGEVLKILKDEDTKISRSPEEVNRLVASMPLDPDLNVPVLDRLGFLLVHLIMSSCHDKDALTLIQHQVFCVLIFASNVEGYSSFLVKQGAMARLVEMLDEQIIAGIKDPKDFVRRVQMNHKILPLLITLNIFAENCDDSREVINDILFPYEEPEIDFSEMNEDEAKEAKKKRHMVGTTPPNTPGGRLIKLMTATDSNVKRLSSEIVWNLCNGDNSDFVRRAGYGNAVHLMAIKGGMLGQMIAKQDDEQKRST